MGFAGCDRVVTVKLQFEEEIAGKRDYRVNTNEKINITINARYPNRLDWTVWKMLKDIIDCVRSYERNVQVTRKKRESRNRAAVHNSYKSLPHLPCRT